MVRAGSAPVAVGSEAGVGRPNRIAAGVDEFCGVLAARMHQLQDHDPESEVPVECRNGLLETSFMPGHTFVSPAGFRRRVP